MKVIDKVESRERCAEAGWFAYDFLLEEPMDQNFIKALRPLGAFVYLQMLKKPFFKVESEHYLLKGIEEDDFFRMAVHKDYLEELNRVEEFVSKI